MRIDGSRYSWRPVWMLLLLPLVAGAGDSSSRIGRLREELRSSDYAVRFEAARQLGSLGGSGTEIHGAVSDLIQALATGSLPFRWRCARSLQSLTGQDFGLNRPAWEAWHQTAPLPATKAMEPSVSHEVHEESPVPPSSGHLLMPEDKEVKEVKEVKEAEKEDPKAGRGVMEAGMPESEADARLQEMQQELLMLRAQRDRLMERQPELTEEISRERSHREEMAGQMHALREELERTQAERRLAQEALEKARRSALPEISPSPERERPEPAAKPHVEAVPPEHTDAKSHTAAQVQPRATRSYVIQRNESLSIIALRFHTDVETLLAMNRDNPRAIQDRHRIFAGRSIVVPAS